MSIAKPVLNLDTLQKFVKDFLSKQRELTNQNASYNNVSFAVSLIVSLIVL